MNDKNDKIEKEKWYSIPEIMREGLMPMVRTEYLLRNLVKENKLKSYKTGSGKASGYAIKGQWIINYINKLN